MSNPVDEKSAEEIEAALQNNNQTLAFAKIKQFLEDVKNPPLNIAITGESGSGKSSFVNGFRGVGDTDENAAPIGCVETTTQVTKYPHPNYPNVALWDLPGIGTTRFPANQYLRYVGFEKYDFFIIISDTRFRENDVTLAKEIQKMGKKFYFVRSKIDNDIRAARRSQWRFNEAGNLAQIRGNCIEGLQRGGVASPQVFLVSRFEPHLYDFPLIHQTLKKELPAHERDVLQHAMHNISQKVINMKKEGFQNQITTHALISAGGAVIPLPGISIALDLSMLVMVTMQYMVGFGLDEESLKRLANIAGVPLGDLKAVLTSPFALKQITPDLISKLLLGCTSTAALLAAEEGFRFIPFIGGLVAAPLSFKLTQNALQTFLDMLAEDAQRVFNKALSVIL